MDAKKFPIGFWNYPPVDAHTPDEVSRWTRCGMTWNLSPSFSYAKHSREQLTAFLDECHRQGMQMNLRIEGLGFRDLLKDEEGYRKLFDRACDDFGSHPATEGFFIGDEPVGEAENRACVDAYKVMLSRAPALSPFLNFYPYIKDFEERVLGGQSFPEWAKQFTAASGCCRICYDCYAQLNEGEEGTDFYFLNLNKYSESAKCCKTVLENYFG